MVYSDFKDLLLANLYGDKSKLPDDNVVQALILQALVEVANRCNPLSLRTDVSDGVILKKIDKEYIRMPNKPIDYMDRIDIDETLVYAVNSLVASKLCGDDKKAYHLRNGRRGIQDYLWAMYESSNSDKSVMDFYGYKGIYTSRFMTINGYVYDFDQEFIKNVNSYLMGETIENISKSDRENLDRYIAYAEGEMSNTDELYSVFEEFDNYLGEL